MGKGGSKALWNFSENSSVLVPLPVPYWSFCDQIIGEYGGKHCQRLNGPDCSLGHFIIVANVRTAFSLFSWPPGGSDLFKNGLSIKFSQFKTHCWCLSHLVPEIQLFVKIKKFFHPLIFNGYTRLRGDGGRSAPPGLNRVKGTSLGYPVLSWNPGYRAHAPLVSS